MKIVHVLNHYLPKQIAGTEVYVHALSKALNIASIESIVIIPNYGKDKTEAYEYESIRVIQFSENSIVDRGILMGRTPPSGLQYFKDILKNEQPSLVHFHTVGGSNGVSLYHVEAAKKMGFRIITTLHIAGYTCSTGNLLYLNKIPCNGLIDFRKCTNCVFDSKDLKGIKRSFLSFLSSILFKLKYDTTNWNTTLGTALGYPNIIAELNTKITRIANASDKIVAITHWYSEVLKLNGIASSKITTITQGLPQINTTKIVSQRPSKLKLIFIGRINYSKGLHLLIDALRTIPAHNISLDIFGQVNDEAYATKLKEESLLMPHIKWNGVLNSNEIVETIRLYSCLCLPSAICEMSPLVIQEAFAGFVPVIASNVYGNAEQIIDGKNGWLFNFADSKSLKNVLLKLIDNPTLIDKAKSNIGTVKTFSSVAKEYIALYNEILACP